MFSTQHHEQHNQDTSKHKNNETQQKEAERYVCFQRVYFGLMVSPSSDRTELIDLTYYSHTSMVPQENSTLHTGASASLPYMDDVVLQITAPAACSSANVTACVLEVVIAPRWSIYFGVVVAPAVLLCVVIVLGLMALKALQMHQDEEEAAKKASGEGVALDTTTKDIHEQKLAEAAQDKESGSSAVLTAAEDADADAAAAAMPPELAAQ